MALFGQNKLDSFESLFLIQLEDLYDAERRLIDALPKMAEASHSPELAAAFRDHHRETQQQASRLERIFRMLDRKPETETCEAMKGLIKEGEAMIDAKGDPMVRDAALIAAAQRVEHYEIAAYGAARTFARRLGQQEAADLLQETLDEEGEADKKLTSIAEESVNVQAAARA